MKKRDSGNEMSFLDHLEELRWHILRASLSIVVFAVAAFVFKDIIFDKVIIAPSRPDFFSNRMFCALGNYFGSQNLCINSKPLILQNINMSGQFNTHIMVSIVAGLIAAFPYVFYEFWKFLSPALYEKERRYTRLAIAVCSILFLTGVLFGYYVITPLSIDFLGNYQVSEQVLNQINIQSYMSTIVSVVLACGIVFELPVIVFFLTKIGLVTPQFLKRYRRHAIVVILIIAAIITPPDIFSQILVSIPLLLLYEGSIIISRVIVTKQAKQESMAG